MKNHSTYKIQHKTYNIKHTTKKKTLLKDLLNVKCYLLNDGFTLIEIMVAATIVALLSTMGISGYQAVTRSGRDALRKTDLEQIRSALEIYKSENNMYPTNTGIGSCLPNSLSPDYINNYPADPKSASYKYCYVYVNNISYKLCAHLENGSDTPSSSYCDDSGGNICTGNCNYQVTNP